MTGFNRRIFEMPRHVLLLRRDSRSFSHERGECKRDSDYWKQVRTGSLIERMADKSKTVGGANWRAASNSALKFVIGRPVHPNSTPIASTAGRQA